MGRLLAFLLGGFALGLYLPQFILPADQLAEYKTWLGENVLVGAWYAKVFEFGPGVFAGLALLLFAVRGREGTPPAY